jgi:hypothetical protein
MRSTRCTLEGCDKERKGFGYCTGHYQRFKKYGSPLADKSLSPAYKPYVDANGYVVVRKNNTHIKVHREIMEEHLGRKLFSKENVHHINGDRTDNRIENLELWSTSQPSGQKIEDKVRWALGIINMYPEIVETIRTV